MTSAPDSGATGQEVTRASAKAADAVTPGPPGVIKIVAPLAEIAATWGVRKLLDSAYRRSTGSEPPRATDRTVPLRQVLMWAAVSAAVLAVVHVVIDRASSQYDV